MKCFWVDECTWYAGETPEQAIAAYIEDCGEDALEGVEEFGAPQEITDMDVVVMDDDEPTGLRLGDILAKMDKPGFVASTEY